MRTAAVLMVLALAGCNLLGPPDLERVDKRAETPEAVAAEMGWRADSFVFDEHGVVAYASRVRDGTLEIAAIEQTGGEWVATMGGDWDDLGDTNTVALGEGMRGGTFIYGSAEAGVAKVVTDAPNAVGGLVTKGGWIIWSPDESLIETDTLGWRFLANDGSIVEEGTGWQWPFGSPFDPPPLAP